MVAVSFAPKVDHGSGALRFLGFVDLSSCGASSADRMQIVGYEDGPTSVSGASGIDTKKDLLVCPLV
jgi:hypothetical protein